MKTDISLRNFIELFMLCNLRQRSVAVSFFPSLLSLSLSHSLSKTWIAYASADMTIK